MSDSPQQQSWNWILQQQMRLMNEHQQRLNMQQTTQPPVVAQSLPLSAPIRRPKSFLEPSKQELEEDLFRYVTQLHRTRRKAIQRQESRRLQRCNRVVESILIEIEQQRQHLNDERTHKSKQPLASPRPKNKPRVSDEVVMLKQKEVWAEICTKAIPKMHAIRMASLHTKYTSLQKIAYAASKVALKHLPSAFILSDESKKDARLSRDVQNRAKRVSKDIGMFWRRNEKEERELRKRAEKERREKLKQQEAEREKIRQRKKLNFLITQTELYTHFVVNKLKPEEVLASTPARAPTRDMDFADMDDAELSEMARQQAQSAVSRQLAKTRDFDQQMKQGKKRDSRIFATNETEIEMDLKNPTMLSNRQIAQPSMLQCQLKPYQMKGLNWLANLYEQGINGILADDMGLGKTVQSISLITWLAEKHNIWGPFLIVTPASTLHNWQQEISRFVPELRALPYWGAAKDRKTLRKFWSSKKSYNRDSPFHVIITSYQIVVQDQQYFQRTKWQYMILDEAHAIKSSNTARWKILLNFNCRNRLLLTGTPIQNNMQELWALLHFIMPTLFDSHEEFSEWFSKDIESHAVNQSTSQLNQHQLSRLHMILKPFMLRRVKSDVEHELGTKIEKTVYCELTPQQRRMYDLLATHISIDTLLDKSSLSDDKEDEALTNMIIHFRKVCNHPQLFEQAVTHSPYLASFHDSTSPWKDFISGHDTRSWLGMRIPRLVFDELILPSLERVKCPSIWTNSNMHESTDEFWFSRAQKRPFGEVVRDSGDLIRSGIHEYLGQQQRNRFDVMYGKYDGQPEYEFRPIDELMHFDRPSRVCKVTALPAVWQLSRVPISFLPGSVAKPVDIECSSANFRTMEMRTDALQEALLQGSPSLLKLVDRDFTDLVLEKPFDAAADNSPIDVPNARQLLFQSGKMRALDALLQELKANGHRVLLYFQMTKMIDLMEDYLSFRKHSYLRLDGSSSIGDRRDMVHDWQTRPELFIFLLSTRAGGLGLNLTAADTVIFYDSDWNPTVDQQAMDRAHRLGQTRQVTVYRMVCRNTIEERILERATQKGEIQKVVISGGGFDQKEDNAAASSSTTTSRAQ